MELPWMPEGKALWNKIKIFNPIILTGCPHNYPSAVEQKLNWCARELGPHIKVITCKTKEKPNYCKEGDILIDDRDVIMKAWIQKNGKYILYTEGKLDSIIDELERSLFKYLKNSINKNNLKVERRLKSFRFLFNHYFLRNLFNYFFFLIIINFKSFNNNFIILV